ncbi:MAG: DNA binding protein [Pseudomonas balearica]|uniref:histone-like nucleoid-structuring protein, MvaT/MvaU family n=1 Tax=Stutzerimonas balearica TaxID=74829 RepID=UPI00198AE17F|nr:histone-like nucleoid-structuring protein, MvaT/MvaU family [Stutzerimonas balearica]MBC7198197.1 DNA binding protein [Stutzerimonas balearica]
MSKLAHYRNTKQQIAQLQAELAKMEADDQIKRELEFETKLHELLKEFDLSPARALALIAPGSAPKREQAQRKERELVVYKNPNSGEIVETKGGNNRVLKAWKTQYGADVVKGWKQS